MQKKKNFPRCIWTKATRIWTEAEDEFLLANVHRSDKDVARELSKLSKRKISKDALRMRRKRLGVTKEEAGRGRTEIKETNLNHQVLGRMRYRYNKLQEE